MVMWVSCPHFSRAIVTMQRRWKSLKFTIAGHIADHASKPLGLEGTRI